jgi:hypothetical protein
VEYGRNDEDEVEDAIERTTSCLSFTTLAFEGNRERFHRKVAEAARRASFIQDRLTEKKSPKRITEMESGKSEVYIEDKLKISWSIW